MQPHEWRSLASLPFGIRPGDSHPGRVRGICPAGRADAFADGERPAAKADGRQRPLLVAGWPEHRLRQVRGRWQSQPGIEGQAEVKRKGGVKQGLTERLSLVLPARGVPPRGRMRGMEGCGRLP